MAGTWEFLFIIKLCLSFSIQICIFPCSVTALSVRTVLSWRDHSYFLQRGFLSRARFGIMNDESTLTLQCQTEAVFNFKVLLSSKAIVGPPDVTLPQKLSAGVFYKAQETALCNNFMGIANVLVSIDSFWANGLCLLHSWCWDPGVLCSWPFPLLLFLFLWPFGRYFSGKNLLSCRFQGLTLLTSRMLLEGCSALGYLLGLWKPRSYRGGISSDGRRHLEVKSHHFAILMNATAVRQPGVLWWYAIKINTCIIALSERT